MAGPVGLYHVRLRYTGVLPWMEMGKRQFNNEVMKPAMEEAGIWWFSKRLPKHFTREAYTLYGYKPRKGEAGNPAYRKGRQVPFPQSYTGRKLRQFGHTDPLVWSGGTRRVVTSMRDVRATSKRVRIVLHGAEHLNYRHPASRIRMADEVRAVNLAEREEAVRIIDRAMDLRLRRVRGGTTTRDVA